MQEQLLGRSDDPSTLLKREYKYDAAGQLTDINDSRRGPLAYRYDPVGRLLSATTRQGVETFTFDPASNLLDNRTTEIRRPLDQTPSRSKLVDNLLREYAGTHYDYDERGNQIQRWHNGTRSDLQWDLFDRLVRFEDPRLTVDFAYDALGRRLHKNSSAHYKQRPEAGSQWNRSEHARKQREYGCGFTLYGWDGDNLAWESSPAQTDGAPGRTVHYIFEPGTFVPVAQAVRHAPINLLGQPDYSGEYSLDEDPLWNHKATASAFDVLAWYQCDHLGTPQELTDPQGNLAWTAQYKAWGQVTEQRSEWARQHGVMNPIRFQGQYHDHETGLHYNRYRYYDPRVGRFVSKDPISYEGGINVYQYAPNPLSWVDPLGLAAHRGRIQAQGAKLEESVAWNQDTPLTAADAKQKLQELKGKLNKKDLAAREDAFKKADKFIDNAAKCGGADAHISQTFMVKDTKHERVDIEVITGKAFVE